MNAAQRRTINEKGKAVRKEAPEVCTVCGTGDLDNFDCPLAYDGHHTSSSK